MVDIKLKTHFISFIEQKTIRGYTPMQRRNFLKNTAILSSAVLVAPSLAFSNEKQNSFGITSNARKFSVINTYDINQNKISILTSFIQTRKEVLNAALKEFELGVKDLTYLLDSYMDYIYTKRELINTSYDLLLAEFRVLEAMGIINEEILDEDLFQLFLKGMNDE